MEVNINEVNINEVNINEVNINEVNINEVNINEVLKKKRGRKPKVKTDEIVSDDISKNLLIDVLQVEQVEQLQEEKQEEENVTQVEQTIKIPKKRGRKPKGGKIIVNSISEETNVIHEPNIILHLKCKFADLKNLSLNYDCSELDTFHFEKNKGSELGYHVIDNNMDVLMSNNTNNNNNNNINNSSLHDTELKNICNKIKNISYNLQNNDISDKKSDCFWCTCSFDNPPIYIPKHQINNIYQCYGCFCSPECATAFLFKESIDTSTRFERYYLLNHIYNKVYNYMKNIKPAPDPYYTLNKYYGSLSIQEYRRLFKSERLLIVVDKPLSRVLPELHEYNDDIMVHENLQNTGKFKIKRKTKQNKTDILNGTFNIQ